MYANVRKTSTRRGVSIIAAMSGFSCWIRATMEPIGSSTSGIQTCSRSVTPARIRLPAPRTVSAPRSYPAAVKLLDRLRAEPRAAAIVLDVDGVLAPIVARPEDSLVPEETREALRDLVARYGLVAAVSGRTTADASRLIDVSGVQVAGTHGLELEPISPEWVHAMHRVAAGLRARFGRMVLELLPPVDVHKGTAVRRLLERSGLSRALYAGDDTTDLD